MQDVGRADAFDKCALPKTNGYDNSTIRQFDKARYNWLAKDSLRECRDATDLERCGESLVDVANQVELERVKSAGRCNEKQFWNDELRAARKEVRQLRKNLRDSQVELSNCRIRWS